MTVTTLLAIASMWFIANALFRSIRDLVWLGRAETVLISFLRSNGDVRVTIQARLSELFGPAGGTDQVTLADTDEAVSFIYRELAQAKFPTHDLNTLVMALAQTSDRARVAYMKKTFDAVRRAFGNLQHAGRRP